MDVGWWTSVVAYLPRNSITETTVAQRATIAGLAWTHLHRRKIEDNNSEDEMMTRDLWEEKHYGGLESMGRGGNRTVAQSRRLPDWSTVEVSEDGMTQVPPFFTVEVEELPRQSSIEWHADMGVVNGRIRVSL